MTHTSIIDSQGPAAPRPAGKRMKRIVVSLLKGGVAKSETSVSLAFGLAARGRKVLLVDTDVQAHCGDMLGVKPERGLADLIAGWDSPDRTLTEARENLWLLAGGNNLAAIKMEIARREMASEAVLSEAFEVFEGEFDYLVMDTAPGWDTLLVNALYAGQDVLSPVSMEPMALSGLVRFEERLEVIRRYKPELRLRWVVPTFVDGRVKKSAEILSQLQARYGDLVGPRIKYSVKASEAPAYGKTVFEHDPKGTAAEGYHRLTDRIIRDCEDRESVATIPAAGPQVGPFPETNRPQPEIKPTGVAAILQTPRADEPPSAPPSAEDKSRLTRTGLIARLELVKDSVPPLSRSRFTQLIKRLESSLTWSREELAGLDRIIDEMVLEEGETPPPDSGPGSEEGNRAAPSALAARLKQTEPAKMKDRDLIRTESIRRRLQEFRTAQG